MPTYSFTRTREQLRDMILRKLRARSDFQTPSAGDNALVYEAMDLRLKELHSLQKLWFQVAGAASNVALVADTATTNAPTDCLFPVSMNIRIGTEDCPVDIIGHQEYQAIANKLDTGQPEKAFFSGGVLRWWPVPNQNYTGKMTYEAIAEDTAANTAPDLPVPMMRSFSIICAADLIDSFAVPEARAARLLKEADRAHIDIARLNAERVNPGTTEATYY